MPDAYGRDYPEGKVTDKNDPCGRDIKPRIVNTRDLMILGEEIQWFHDFGLDESDISGSWNCFN